jgi:hypothetical protein
VYKACSEALRGKEGVDHSQAKLEHNNGEGSIGEYVRGKDLARHLRDHPEKMDRLVKPVGAGEDEDLPVCPTGRLRVPCVPMRAMQPSTPNEATPPPSKHTHTHYTRLRLRVPCAPLQVATWRNRSATWSTSSSTRSCS